MTLKRFLSSEPPDVPLALAAIEEAARCLYPHTYFRSGSYDLYRIIIEGRATRAHEALAENLQKI